ncbi:DUF6807 family protein [Flavilitoribacter nigricans]|uniref:Methane oxygenase PmoA n=1 Tax=Flavilitoribacter nigricans (strain ATCC 23147 / DSM 23189 / NBRC 102662 / NCIMB 1420 / SS-2) TaxID=1122177 RepID=A0A2D0NKG5_FLAN2|nr:DUF6807 family protein [Flavilitoribacter nigricans]PHN08233.1 hypothetical protein CRP01_02610 [Flavilitoribacter nigricans DSM 23189 = NBRC 102662]
MQKTTLLVALATIFLLISCQQKSGEWVVKEDQNGVLILEGTDSVLFFQKATRSLNGEFPRANYIHPLYGLDNNRMTEDFPADHLHHRGIFWAWHQNYVGEKSVGDAWALENFSWQVDQVKVDPSSGGCKLETVVYWKSPLWLDANGQQQPFVEERAEINIHPAQGNYRIIDFAIELEALVDGFAIGGSEDVKGYSGFSWRIPLPGDVNFRGVNGNVKPQNEALEAGPYMDISGNLDGRPGREGVVVIDDPANPAYPNPWILRSARSMQNVAFPGREKYSIPKDQPLLLKYRMIVYKDELDPGLFHPNRP